MALEEEKDRPLLPVKERDDEEKLVIKIATISLILRRLGFQIGQINQCLKNVPELELEAAINWVSPLIDAIMYEGHADGLPGYTDVFTI